MALCGQALAVTVCGSVSAQVAPGQGTLIIPRPSTSGGSPAEVTVRVESTEVPKTDAWLDGLSTELSTGFDSHYMFRGLTYGRDLRWVQLALSLELPWEGLSLGVTPWLAGADGGYHELDLAYGLAYEGEGFEAFATYYTYHYPKGSVPDNQYEINVGGSIELGPLALGGLLVHEFAAGGNYLEINLGHTVTVSDDLQLELGAAVGYHDEYSTQGSGLNHLQLMLAAPYQLRENLSISPYIATNLPFDAITDIEDTTFFGGVQMKLSF